MLVSEGQATSSMGAMEAAETSGLVLIQDFHSRNMFARLCSCRVNVDNTVSWPHQLELPKIIESKVCISKLISQRD